MVLLFIYLNFGKLGSYKTLKSATDIVLYNICFVYKIRNKCLPSNGYIAIHRCSYQQRHLFKTGKSAAITCGLLLLITVIINIIKTRPRQSQQHLTWQQPCLIKYVTCIEDFLPSGVKTWTRKHFPVAATTKTILRKIKNIINMIKNIYLFLFLDILFLILFFLD